MPELSDFFAVAVIGGGAAGLATGIFARRANPAATLAVFEGARKPGAKILVSGGGRCNVTNAIVRDTDFWGGSRAIVRRVLRALPVSETVALFADMGLRLHEEAAGKLFPDSNRARDVLDALLGAASANGVGLLTDTRVHSIERTVDGFTVETSRGSCRAGSVVLATGGQSLPKTGSDGAGYRIATRLGHSLVSPTPALAPLVLEKGGFHESLSGTAVDGEISLWVDDAIETRLTGALLWTHFGISGPLVLNVSRHWARARLEHRAVRLTLNFYPGDRFDAIEARWIAAAAHRPRMSIRTALAADVPDALAVALLDAVNVPADRTVAELTRDERRRLVHALVEWPLPVVDTRGYNYAEVTAGGVPLSEIDPATMESRVCPGLFLVGEILDVDGRIGGFNFQWAWSSAFVAARGLASRDRRQI